MPRVIKWISYESAERLDGAVNVGGWGGFMTEEMGWPDYIAEFTPRIAAYHEVLKEAILARGLRRGGDWHQSAADGAPLFDDGAIGTFSFRGWGDLMAACLERRRRPRLWLHALLHGQLPAGRRHGPVAAFVSGPLRR